MHSITEETGEINDEGHVPHVSGMESRKIMALVLRV